MYEGECVSMAELKMTHNKYKLFLKQNANRIYDKNDDYGFKEYKKDACSIEIIDFDLSDYNLPIEIEKYINIIFTEENTNEKGVLILKGFAINEDYLYKVINKLSLNYKEYGHSGYGYNYDLKLYLTYTEGDLYLSLFKSTEEYNSSFKETVDWYKEEYGY